MAKDQSLGTGTAPRDIGETPLRVRRGRVDSVDLYEIKDSELDLLERGSPADLQLNFSIFLLSLAFSGVSALATAIFDDQRIYLTFLVITVCSTLIGIFLLISWFRNRTSLKVVCNRIRQRMPIDGPGANSSSEDSFKPGSDRPSN